MANAPPVPINNDVKLGICPNFYTYVDDLNLTPSADTNDKLCNWLFNDPLFNNGRLFDIT